MESYIRLFFSDFAYTHPSPLALTCQPTCAVVYMLTYTYTQHNAPTALVSRLNDSLLCQKLSESHFVLCLFSGLSECASSLMSSRVGLSITINL